MTHLAEAARLDTQGWLERAVIGLNLCPFAKAVHVKRQLRYEVQLGTDPDPILLSLERELRMLAGAPIEQIETTLLILPEAFPDFLDFNAFLASAEALLRALDLEGVLQLASFHPQFQFAGTNADDITNCTNRSPYPTLHLLREQSIDRAVQVFADTDSIWQANVACMEQLGPAGWSRLNVGAGNSRAQGNSITERDAV